jgi:hypothetical protein
VRPSRLALAATALPLSGVGAVSAGGSGAGFAAGLRAVRRARLGAPCGSLPARVALCGFGGDTTTGSSVRCCANTGVAATSSGNAAPGSRREIKTVRAHRRDGAWKLRILKMDTTRSTANNQPVMHACRDYPPFAFDAADSYSCCDASEHPARRVRA